MKEVRGRRERRGSPADSGRKGNHQVRAGAETGHATSRDEDASNQGTDAWAGETVASTGEPGSGARANGAEGPGKPLGQILVEEGILQPEDLDKLIEAQKEQTGSNRLPLGRLAVELGHLSERRLRDLLDLHGKRLSLGELLVSRGFVEPGALEQALARQAAEGGLLGEILVEEGCLDELTLTRVLAEQNDIPFVPLKDDESWKKGLTFLINRQYAVRHGVVPISQIGRVLTVAIWHPAALALAAEIEQSTGLTVRFVLDMRGSVRERLHNLYGSEEAPAAPRAAARIAASSDGAPPTATGPFASLGLEPEQTRALEQVQLRGEGVFLVCGVTPSVVEETYLGLLRLAKVSGGRRSVSESPLQGMGEIRDASQAHALFGEISSRGLRMALFTAHNTTDALDRLLRLGVNADRLAADLAGVLAVCSIRRVCPECAEDHPPHKLVLLEWFGNQPPPKDARWRRGSGCAACDSTGYRGTMIVSEFWVPSEEDRQWIREQAEREMSPRKLREDLLDRLTGIGFQALRQALHGETTLEEVLKALPSQEVRAVRKTA